MYYRSPVNRHALRRSVVIDLRLNSRDRCYEQVMRNGDIVTKQAELIHDNSTFPSLEIAMSHIMATLIERININRVSINSLTHELCKKQRILNTMRNLHPHIKPKRYDHLTPMPPDELEALFDFYPTPHEDE